MIINRKIFGLIGLAGIFVFCIAILIVINITKDKEPEKEEPKEETVSVEETKEEPEQEEMKDAILEVGAAVEEKEVVGHVESKAKEIVEAGTAYSPQSESEVPVDDKSAEVILSEKLAAVTAWQEVEIYGEKQFPYGFKVHYIKGLLAQEAEDENTWFLKATCDVTNIYGTVESMNCEANVTGTNDDPVVTYFNVY